MLERLLIDITKFNSQQIGNIIKDLIDKRVNKVIYESEKKNLNIYRKLDPSEISIPIEKKLYQTAMSKNIEEYSGGLLDLLFMLDSSHLIPHYILCGNKKNLLNWANMRNKLVVTLCGIDIYKVEELEQNCALFLLSEDRNEENIQCAIKVEF